MIYAIDFGTTNSLLGAATSKGLEMPIVLDPEARDPKILRSVLFFPGDRRCFYGGEAVQEFVKHGMEGRLVRSVKKFLPMKSFVSTLIDNRTMTLEEIIAMFLGEMRRRANEHFQADVTSVLLGRPARFSADDEADRLAQNRLENAAKMAGFKNIQFCPEPVAAACEFRAELTDAKTVLVCDFGGGTSDFTVVRISNKEFKASDVLSVGGVSVAGDALDGAVMRKRISKHFGSDVQYKAPFGSNVLKMPLHLMEKICSPADISLLQGRDTIEFFKNVRSWSLGTEDQQKMDRLFSLINDQFGFELFEEIERSKRVLAEKPSEKFSFHRLDIDINEKITRSQFEDYTQEMVEKIVASLDQTIQDAQLKYEDIDLICSTGGTAKVPAIHKALEERFGPRKIQEKNRFHSVIQGLIRMAANDLPKLQ